MNGRPLTPALSPGYRGEGEVGDGQVVASSSVGGASEAAGRVSLCRLSTAPAPRRAKAVAMAVQPHWRVVRGTERQARERVIWPRCSMPRRIADVECPRIAAATQAPEATRNATR